MQPSSGTLRLASLALTLALTACSSSQDGAGPSPSATATSGPAASGAPTAATAAIPTAAVSATGASITATKGPPREQHRYIEAASWSPTGDKLAVWCANACLPEPTKPGAPPRRGAPEPRVIHVVDLPSGAARTVQVHEGDDAPLRAASFSPKGGFLLSSIQNFITAHRVADLSEAWKTERLAVYEMYAVSPDETRVALIDAFGQADVVDLATKQTLTHTSLHDPNAGLNALVRWAPATDRVVFGCDTCAPELWGMKDKRISRFNVEAATWGMNDVLPRPDGTMVVADTSGAVALFDPATGKAKSVLRKPTKQDPSAPAVTQLTTALTPDGKHLLVVRPGVDAVLFDLDAKAETVLLQGEATQLSWGAALAPDASLVALGAEETVRVVSVASKSVTATLTGLLVGFTADNALVTRTRAGDVIAWSSGREKWRVIAGVTTEPDIDFSPDRKVVSIANGSLTLVRSEGGKTATLALEPGPKGLALSPLAGTAPTDVSAVLSR